eukprot:TRINITY_DN935_c0_g1_i1.p2 TRINITY_DN935_c0_g1~~TRINITY_DN935_c0_g1_i1.p2  ORF type:complete len:254 (-),score=66.60 TRINITY_DN935_c0_g1_i1:19-780(-)
MTERTSRRKALRSDETPSNLHELLCIVQKQDDFRREQEQKAPAVQDVAAAAQKKRSSSVKAPAKFRFIDRDISKFSERFDDFDIRDHFDALSRHHRRVSSKRNTLTPDNIHLSVKSGNSRLRSKSLGKLKISGSVAPHEAPVVTEMEESLESSKDSLDLQRMKKRAEEIAQEADALLLQLEPDNKRRKSDFMIKRQVEITEISLFSPRDELAEKEKLPVRDLSSYEFEDEAADVDSDDNFNESGKFVKMNNVI